MPSRAASRCEHPRCATLTKDTRCEQHRSARNRDRGSAASRGYDYRWKKARERQLRDHPLCERCKANGTIRPATQVHHRDGDATGPRRLDPANHESLCTPCHLGDEHGGRNGRAV